MQFYATQVGNFILHGSVCSLISSKPAAATSTPESGYNYHIRLNSAKITWNNHVKFVQLTMTLSSVLDIAIIISMGGSRGVALCAQAPPPSRYETKFGRFEATRNLPKAVDIQPMTAMTHIW